MGACGLLIVDGFSIVGAQEPAPVDAGAIERVESVRKLLTVRLDPKPGSRPGECERLAAGDVAVAAGGVPARVTAVERVPAPERHWLLIDTSGSAEGARREAKRSAARYIRELLGSSRHRAAVVAIDEDAVLIDGPTSDVPHLLDRVESIAPGGQSLLIDGLEDVLRQVEGDRREHLIVYWTDGPMFFYRSAGGKMVFDRNLYWRTDAVPLMSDLRVISDWRQEGFDLTSEFRDPRFSAPEKGNFQLASSSPAHVMPVLGEAGRRR